MKPKKCLYRCWTLIMFVLALFVSVGAVTNRLGIVIPVAIASAIASAIDFWTTWQLSDVIARLFGAGRHRHP